MSKSYIEELFALQVRALKLPEPVREFKFCPDRKWRFDFCWPDKKLAIEVEGGIWTNGRHNRGQGMKDDMVKYNRAARMGWKVLRFDAGAVNDGLAIKEVEEALRAVLEGDG